jgi:hypothetical protein
MGPKAGLVDLLRRKILFLPGMELRMVGWWVSRLVGLLVGWLVGW